MMLIPQGMAYAMIAGLPVVYGLYASIVPLIVYAVMGTSKQLAVGPVAMDSLLVASGLLGLAAAGTGRYIELALLLALMTGVLQLTLGLLRMGFLANFLSRPVISGFTSAAALIISLNQLPNLMGIKMERSSHLHHLLSGAWSSAKQLDGATLGMSAVSMALLLGLRRWTPKVPSALVVVVLGILFVQWSGIDFDVVGEVPSGLPGFEFPTVNWGDVQLLLPMAGTLALIAFMESFSVATAVSEKEANSGLDANQELRALGTANLLGSWFGSYPITGGFSRTAVNVRSGAKTGMSGLISAGVVALTLTFMMPVFAPLPTAVLGAIIVVAVLGLVNVQYFCKLWYTHKAEAVLLLLTFSLTAFAGMVAGIASGMALSLVLTLYRTSMPHTAELGQINGVYRNVHRFPEAIQPEGQLILRFDGPLNYASQAHFKRFVLSRLSNRQDKGEPIQRVVLSAESIPHLDATAVAMLEELLDQFDTDNIALHMAGPTGPVRDVLERSGLMKRIGTERFHTGLATAMGHVTATEDRKGMATQTLHPKNS